MNVIPVAFLLILFLFLGYKFYGGFIEKNIVKPEANRITPAEKINDGIDYAPAKKLLLFGHHFSAIAGAGPILGPLIAVLYFGWLGAVIWVAVGSVFLGAVHDYISLMVSVRHDGTSLADISDKTLGVRAKMIFSIFLWLALALVIAVFAVVTAKTLVSSPEIVIPTFGLMFLAMIFGWLIYRKGVHVGAATVFALIVLLLLIYLGVLIPISLPAQILGISNLHIWFFILIIYSLLASYLPVWFLLQPRGYICTWILFAGLGLGYVGLLLSNPSFNAPAFVSFSGAGGPLWPMLFVIIACGAISGFHAVVAGGTSAKQLAHETHGKFIGYGSMALEAVLAGLVIFIAASALVWDPSAAENPFGFQYLMTSSGDPVQAFAAGYAKFIDSIPGLSITAGLFFGMLMLNTFVLTSLDTSVRLGRFIFSELLEKKIPLFRNRWITSLIIVILASFLGITESYKAIWPVFGASNQLIAAFSFIVVTSYLVGLKRPKAYTLYPTYFMLLTTVAALVYQSLNFFKLGNFALAGISLALIILAAMIIYDARMILFSRKKTLPSP